MHGMWTVKRGMLLTGGIALVSTGLALHIPVTVSLSIAACALPLCLLPRLRRTVVFSAAAMILFLVSGTLQVVRREQSLRPLCGTADILCGQVIDRAGSSVIMRVTEAQCVPHGTKVLLYCSEQCMPELYDMVSAPVQLAAAPTYRRGDGVFLAAYPTRYGDGAVEAQPGQAPATDPLYPLRCRMAERLRRRLPGEEGALLCALCLGVRDGLSDTAVSAFRTCGIPHLLVVSGLHLMAVSGGVYMLLRRCRLPRVLTWALASGATVFYALLVGLTPSVCRAGVMCLTALTGRLIHRRADGLNSLGLAAAVMLLIDPYQLLNISFQLSFTAVAGILLFTPRLQAWMAPPEALPERWCPLWRAVTGSLAVSVGALLPLSPLMALYFGRLSLIAPLANLLAVPVAGWALACGCCGLLTGMLPWVGDFFSNAFLLPAGVLGRCLLRLADWFARVPWADVPLTRPWQYVALTVAVTAVMGMLWWGRRRWIPLLCGILTTLLLAAMATDNRLMRGVTQVTLFPGNTVAVMIRQGDACAVISRDASALDAVTATLERRGGTPPGLVLLTGGDSTCVAYVTDFMGRYPHARLTLTDPASPLLTDPCVPGATADTRSAIPLTSTALLMQTPDGHRIQIGDSTLTLAPDGTVSLSGLDRPLTVTRSLTLTTRSAGEWSIETWN